MALSLALLGVFVFVFSMCPQHLRMSLLLSASISAPYGFASVFFVPEYWDPVRVFELSAGLEDIMFSFANGGAVWMIAIWALRDRVRLEINPKRIIGHSLGYLIFGYSCYILLRLLGIGTMASAVISICALGAVVLAARRELWRLALAGSLSFGLLYFGIIRACFVIFPEFILQWNDVNLWGPFAFGVPIDEIAWAASFGAVWPMMMAWAFRAQFVLKGNTKKREGIRCSDDPAVGV